MLGSVSSTKLMSTFFNVFPRVGERLHAFYTRWLFARGDMEFSGVKMFQTEVDAARDFIGRLKSAETRLRVLDEIASDQDCRRSTGTGLSVACRVGL